MAKAAFTLPNGTVVEIEGSTQEVKDLLEFYGGGASNAAAPDRKQSAKKAGRKKKAAAPIEAESEAFDVTEIVNEVKSCDEAENIEARILDKSSQVDRTLLPMYVVHEYLDNEHALSSGDINKVTTQLSVPVAQPNVSNTLSGTAAKYVTGDRTRKRGGRAVRYKLNRRGVKYLKSVIIGDSGE